MHSTLKPMNKLIFQLNLILMEACVLYDRTMNLKIMLILLEQYDQQYYSIDENSIQLSAICKGIARDNFGFY